MQQKLQLGDRVRVANLEYRGFWANGVSGQIACPPDAVVSIAGDWSGYVRMVRTARGVEPYFWVVLDEARLDNDGDGPYGQAELAGAWLMLLQ